LPDSCHLHNLAHDLDIATRDAHAARQSARDRFSAEGVGDPFTPLPATLGF
jgi:hypothetical protein